MRDFGKMLWSAYLDIHLPRPDIRGREQLKPPLIDNLAGHDCAEFLWRTIEMLGVHSMPDTEEAWQRAVCEVDVALADVAISGDFSPLQGLSSEGFAELADRLSFGIVGATMEDEAKTGFSIPVPRFAEDHVKELCVFLFVSGGPGRDRPTQWLQRFLR
jgi:hypothetical protein